jgi:hypothetical protein
MAEEKLSDRVAQDVKNYVDLRVDDAKLAIIDGLSSIAGSAISAVIGLLLINLAFIIFTALFIYLIDLWIHSWAWAAMIVGVIYLTAGIVVMLKPGGFRNMMVKVFAPMFFRPEKYEDDDDE